MTTMLQDRLPTTPPRKWLGSWSIPKLSTAALILLSIMLVAVALNFINIQAIGSANIYYTAAVKSMLQSPSNFFFVAAEPGGSVSIDKPPLGLWLQAISALFLGVNGLAVSLPQILAGIFSVPILYVLVKRYFGTGAGLIAAFVLAVTPVSIAAQRNNTMDATLIFTLLLAAWAFIKATDTGKLRWLLAGGVLVGLGFNIKMMEAFLPLPAFYASYFFGAKVGWRRKIGHLVATTVVLLAVSLSWVVAVDLTPASERPYVGSSSTNSALELALGYNGLERLFGGVLGDGGNNGGALAQTQNADMTPPSGFTLPTTDANGQSFAPPTGVNGEFPTPPNGDGGQFPGGAGGGGIGTGEIGNPGILRLFTAPLANEISWLLPFGLFAAALVAISKRVRLPFSTEHKGVILWGGWLLTEVVFFSAASFFHAYYLAMLAPPLAALVGIGVMHLWHMQERHHWLAGLLMIATGAATLAFQIWVASQYTSSLWWVALPIAAMVVGAVLMLQRIPRLKKASVVGFACIIVAMTAVPAVWAGMTTLDTAGNNSLPHAYEGGTAGNDGMMGGDRSSVNSDLLTYLEANTQNTKYMMAVMSSGQGDEYVLEIGRAVFFIGGFTGRDPVIDAAGLQKLVDVGELKYVLWGGNGPGGGSSNSDIRSWLQSTCTVVSDVSTNSGTLYQCTPSASTTSAA